jgi:hypothetical protein
VPISHADLFNVPTELKFEGVTYTLRKPTQLEMGQFQRWLEQRAYDGIARRTYQSDAEKAEDRKLLNRDIAAGLYEFGRGEVAIKTLATPTGLAKLLTIICTDPPIDLETAERLVVANLLELFRIMLDCVEQTGEDSDPKAARAALAAALRDQGLSAGFLFSPNSQTRPSASQSKRSRKRRTRK